VSRNCSVVDSIDCEASSNNVARGPVVTCWACGDDVCLVCSSIVSYRWRGQRRRMRFCFSCQDTRGVGRGEKSSSRESSGEPSSRQSSGRKAS
jgi:hypothetical protein